MNEKLPKNWWGKKALIIHKTQTREKFEFATIKILQEF